MSEEYQEAVRSIPCFDKEILSVGSCVHVLEIDPETEEINEIYGLIKKVKLDELIISYFDGEKSVDAMKQKRIPIDNVVNKSCSIEVLKPRHKKERTDQLNEKKKGELVLKKIPLPHLSF